MFGYLTPNRDELRVREMRLYRSHYCGVCRAMKKNCGARCCMGLSYDSAFLSLLGDSLGSSVASIFETRCPFKPWKKLFAVECDASDYAAQANTYLTYLKCLDDKADEHHLRGTMGSALFARPGQAAKSVLGNVAQKIDDGMQTLAALEREGCDRMDEPAIAFGTVMEGLFEGLPGASTKSAQALGWMGRNIGRWVYLVDAYDDLDKDNTSGSYNVLLRQFGSPSAVRAQRERIEMGLMQSLYQASGALAFLPENDLTPILNNILHLGAPGRTKAVLDGLSGKKNKKNKTNTKYGRASGAAKQGAAAQRAGQQNDYITSGQQEDT